MYQRSSGLLCHFTSLPGPHGIGDLGPDSFAFVDLLQEAGQHLWQVLPLGPAGAGDSPYDSRSSFAGNPLLISIQGLVDDGLVDPGVVKASSDFASGHVNFRAVERWKGQHLRSAFQAFADGRFTRLEREFRAFQERSASWLDDYALYQALSEEQETTAWYTWPEKIRSRDATAMKSIRESLRDEIEFHEFVQFMFDRQWDELKEYANERGVAIMGDIPIYVALDSADVWANQSQFLLDDDGQPEKQAGVPPDLFAEDGQLWGNPVYDWDAMAEDGYAWWIARMSRIAELTDLVRVDHFRGFAAGWQVPADEKTAINGEWIPGPGLDLFDTLREELGELAIVVEDLGVITEDVEELRDSLGYPGMKVLQFAFGEDASNPYLPHNHQRNSMVYTGTHDNETTAGWYQSSNRKTQRHIRDYLTTRKSRVAHDVVRATWASVGVIACAPVQDILGLGNEARMNVPGEATGNWGWRLERLEDLAEHTGFLREISTLYGRNSPPVPVRGD
jgi:4-alpha-glucanotransferase